LELCASIQVQYRLTVLSSETRPNAKPETVSGNQNKKMKRQFLKPSKKIADFVEEVFIFENSHVETSFSMPLFANGKPTLQFQTTKGQLKNNSNYLTLFGQTVIPDKITFEQEFTLIAYFFKPFALKYLYGFSAIELTNNPIKLTLIDSKRTNELQERLLNTDSTEQIMELLDNYIYNLITKVKSDYLLIRNATDLMIEDCSNKTLKEIQDKLYITERTFQRLFADQIGLSPIKYRRIVQFDKAFQQLNRNRFSNLTDVALTNSYADQSHFIRSFKEFTNMTPSEYLNMGKFIDV
jgi:AraC-like DNA-binding protein